MTHTPPRFDKEAVIDREAVLVFSEAMLSKLDRKRNQGRGGWHDPDMCSDAGLARLAVEHLLKTNNPENYVDVANIMMMLYLRGADPTAVSAAISRETGVKGGDAYTAEIPAVLGKAQDEIGKVIGHFLKDDTLRFTKDPTIQEKPQETAQEAPTERFVSKRGQSPATSQEVPTATPTPAPTPSPTPPVDSGVSEIIWYYSQRPDGSQIWFSSPNGRVEYHITKTIDEDGYLLQRRGGKPTDPPGGAVLASLAQAKHVALKMAKGLSLKQAIYM